MPCLPPRVVYKYVPIKDLHYLDNGNLQIGSLYGYRRMEGARADPEEAMGMYETVSFTVNNLVKGSVEDRLLQRTGGYFGEGISMTFEACYDDISCCESYCCCFSTEPNIPDPYGVKQAVYRVSNLWRLKSRLEELHPPLQNVVSRPGRVIYKPRGGQDIFDPYAFAPSPFIKPPSFAWEKEVRLLWNCGNMTEAEPLAIPDPEVRSLLQFAGVI